MVYRKRAVAATAMALSLLSPALSRATSADPLAVIDVSHASLPATARDWSDVVALRDDLGNGLLLVELDDATRASAAALHAPLAVVDRAPAGTTYYRVVGAGPVERAMLRSAAVIWSDDRQALVRAKDGEVWPLAGDGVAVYRVPDHARVSAPPSSFAAPDYPQVDTMVARVTGNELQTFDQTLQDFGTRYSNLQGGLDAQAWLVQQFQSYGYDQIAQTAVPNIQAKNVCATLPGTTTPEQVYVIGGHYDSITSNHANAPGADDNGSGTSGVLEVAKALSGYSFQSTIVFCGYAGEELGLLGSQQHAGDLKAAGTQVKGMINLDMIGYLEPGDSMDIDVLANGSSAAMRQLFSDVVARYVPSAIEVDGQIPPGASSDHASFWQEGFPAIMLFEDSGNYTPYLHTANDTVGTSFNSPALAEQTVKAATAMLAVMAVPATSGPTPTPTPNPTGTPGNGVDTVHGGCGCDLGGDASGLASPALALGLAMAAFFRRRR